MSLFSEIGKYFSLVKFAHTVFALPFAMTGFLLALCGGEAYFTWLLLLQIVLCMVFARNSAMGFNRYADRKIDALNPRTSGRDIPAGRLSATNALIFTVVNILLFVATCATINPLCFFLSFGALLFLLGYSYLKRFTFLCHFGVGAALCIAPAGAYVAVTGHLSVPVVLLSAIVFLWSSGFDIIYSLSDEEIDRAQGLHSIPQRFGRRRAIVISIVTHSLVLPLLTLFYVKASLGLAGLSGCVAFAAFLIYQHAIISAKDISRLNAAFFTSNGLASVVFAIFIFIDKLCF